MIYLDEKTTAALISHELAYKAVKAAFSSVQDQHSSIFPVVNASGPIEGSMFSLKSACTNQLLGWKMGSYGLAIISLGDRTMVLISFFFHRIRGK